MALVFLGYQNVPTYIALSTDISGGAIAGASIVGGTVFLTDTNLWKIIKSDTSLDDYWLPVSFNGTVNIGTVNQGTAGSTAWPVSLPASELHLGSVGGNAVDIDVVPTLTVAATYVSGDYVGASGTAMTFSGASRINNSTGTILSAVLIDYALQSVSTELWLFDTAPTPPADSAAWSLSDADMARCIGIIPFSTYYASALNSISFASSVGIGFKTITASTSIYGCLVTRGAPTYASGDLTVRLSIWQD